MRIITQFLIIMALSVIVAMPAQAQQQANDPAAATEEPAAPACAACAASPVGFCLECCVGELVGSMPCMECGSTEMCEHKQGLMDRTLAAYDGLLAEETALEALPVAYIATTIGGDISGAFSTLMEQAGKQQLLGPDSRVLAIYPDAMNMGYTMESPMQCAISAAPAAALAEPLKDATIPGGKYLVVEHLGSYMELDASWLATIAYAIQHGLAMGTSACFEEYMSDPETTPEAELLTRIYIPLAAATSEEAPEIVELPVFRVIGLELVCRAEDMAKIPALWEEFVPRMEELAAFTEVYGVSLPVDGDPEAFRYLACARVADDAPVPDGMVAVTVPAAKYALFPFRGPVQEMGQAFADIYGRRLAAAGLTPANGGMPCLELYLDEESDEATGEMRVDLYVAVE